MHHFGVLIPSTNTTAEIEYSRHLPADWQAHYARMMTSSAEKTPFSPPKDEDVDYQAKLLGSARVEAIFLLQTSASLFRDGYCADVSRRIGAAAGGVPAFTSAPSSNTTACSPRLFAAPCRPRNSWPDSFRIPSKSPRTSGCARSTSAFWTD